MDWFVIGDTHSHHEAIKKLLTQEGLYKNGKRLHKNEVTVVHLGDITNGVLKSRDEDLKSLDLVGRVIDILLFGNHEAPYFGFPAFNGFFFFPEIKEKLTSLKEKGLIHPALSIDNKILLSHAGVGKELGQTLGTPEKAVQRAYDAFLHNPLDPILYDIGWSRGGSKKYGGILWADWSEPKTNKFTQIVGHSQGEEVRMYCRDERGENRVNILSYELIWPITWGKEERAYCIDINCNLTGFMPSDRIAGAWITEEGIRFVTNG